MKWPIITLFTLGLACAAGCTDSTDSDSDSDSDSDTEVSLPCEESDFPAAGPGELNEQWLGILEDGNEDCPAPKSPWTGEKLFQNSTGSLAKYCIYKAPLGEPVELCGLPYYGEVPPWEWLDRDRVGG